MTTDGIIRPDAEPKPKFLRSSLLDSAFYARHEAAILAACREGRIVDDVTEARWGTRGKPLWGKPFGGGK
jgi:hypothetical protein